jgi:toxin ParE1/3/4
MRLPYVYSLNSRRDVVEIGSYLGQSSMAAADRFLAALGEAVRGLADMPGKGRLLEDPEPSLIGTRRWAVSGFPNHLILYRERGGVLQVLRIVHGARDLERLLADEAIEFEP